MATAFPDVPAADRPGGARAWIVLWILCAVYVLNFLDRSLLGILAKPIQDSLHISDGQLGRIGGLYFALFYCFIAVPVGFFADRLSRVRVVSLACAIWSGATMACGFAATYPQLVVARMLVGVGEAGGVPPSYSIITDTFPPGKRGTAFGIYNLGPPIGAALGVAFGAKIAAVFDWHAAFIAIGAVGIVIALIVFMVVREPPRGRFDVPGAYPGKAGFWSTPKMFFTHPVLMLASLGSGATQMVTYGMGNFAVLFLMREKGMTLNQVSLWYALVAGIGMSAGILVSGRVIDRFAVKSRVGYGKVPAATLALALPFYLGFVWAPTWPLALVLLLGPMFLNYFYLSSAVALVQEEVRPDQRVLSGALLLLVMNFIGLGMGTDVRRCGERLADTGASATFAATGALCADAVLFDRHRLVPVAGETAATRGRGKDRMMAKWLMAGVAMAAAIVGTPATARDASGPVVTAPAGTVQGRTDGTIRVFRGIPYAAPPVGPLRWQPPQPAARWTGTHAAADFGPACVQPDSMNPSVYGAPAPPMSEDCLTLNVWTPANAANAPVMVWIHGGALVGGSSREPAAVRRPQARRARDHRRVDQLSTRGARLSGASGAERGVAEPCVGQLRPARPDRRAALGPRQHRQLRRRSRAGDDRR